MSFRVMTVGLLCFLSLGLGCDDNPSIQQPGRVHGGASAPRGKVSAWPVSATLPLVIVDTSGQGIRDEPKIPARLTLIYDPAGGSNYLGSPHVAFDGPIKIEIRGKTSQQFPKKQYSLKLKEEAALLDFPSATDWILLGPYADKTLMRDFLAYEFSNRMGRYATRTRYVEMILNDSGDAEAQPRHYVGVYLLMERIERGPNRVRIGYDTSVDETGNDPAFIMKIDKHDPGERIFQTPFGTRVIHVYPSGSPPDSRSRGAEKYLAAFETALAGDGFEDEERGYQRYADVASFADYFIVNELFKNIDAYRLSTYFHKDRGGKLQMGPIWDFNLSLGNANYYSGWKTRGWLAAYVPSGEGFPIPFWWGRLLESRPFRQRVGVRWRELRAEVLSDSSLVGAIDQTATLLGEAQQRNFQKWRVLGQFVWPNPSPVPKTYEEEIERLKSWITQRAAWMDKELQTF